MDPDLAANRSIVDLTLAPLNEAGRVEFSADLYILKPRDLAKSNGTVLLDVLNRGRKLVIAGFNRGTGNTTLDTADQLGDGFLMDHGFTVVWLGWQFDVPRQPGLMRLYSPVAQGLTGPVRAEFVPTQRTERMPLSEREHVPYAVAADKTAKLTIRERHDGERRVIPATEWTLSDEGYITMSSGFEPGKIYEAVYTAKDPAVVGLGLAAVRDLISFLKYSQKSEVLGAHAPLKRAIGFGASQSGRFLRTFLYGGFNSDESGRQVFDAVWPHVAGAGRGSFNIRFGQPSRDAQPFGNFFYPTDLFPFTDLEETDPATGDKGGLLHAEKKIPKIIYTNGGYEYWGRAASLIHTTPDGKRDLPRAPGTRIYSFAGAPHGPGSFPPQRRNTRYLLNPSDNRDVMRALLIAVQEWIATGKEPPPSFYPQISKGQLTSLDKLNFPEIPELDVPGRVHKAYRVNYGPEFKGKGIVSVEPPEVGDAFTVLVPQVDDDGNEIAGIRIPEVACPLGTYTGWNYRSADMGAPNELIAFLGSFFPFPRTSSERAASKDPRQSIAERYETKQTYLGCVSRAAEGLVSRRLVLKSDVPAIMERASRQWDYLTGQN
jgi:hypothetical protein